MKCIDAFIKISGLNCNIEKTKVVLIGDFDRENRICQDINLDWCDEFTLLGFHIENKLENLKQNLTNINVKVNNLINQWRLCYLSLHGHITIVKSILLAQYIYIGTVMGILNEEDKKKIQNTLHQFVAYNEVYMSSRTTWIPDDIMYALTKEVEFNMIKVKDFLHALKNS